jgi:branched-chain amino acid transport system permease protein
MIDTLLNPYHIQIACFLLLNILLAISVYIPLSTGQLSLASAGFMGLGAYASTILTIQIGYPISIAILAGALVSAVCAIVIGFPILRLQGMFLTIATLGFGEVIRVIFNNLKITNGPMGIPGIPHLGTEFLTFLERFKLNFEQFGLQYNQVISILTFLPILFITIGVIWFFNRQSNSRIGRAFMAISSDEKAAESMGVNSKYYKIIVFTQSAFIAGLVGGLYAHTTTFINPGDFAYTRAIDSLIFVIFGGSEVLLGPIFGGFFLTLLPEILRETEEYRLMIYGALLVLMMIFRPQGIIDGKFLARFTQKKGTKN